MEILDKLLDEILRRMPVNSRLFLYIYCLVYFSGFEGDDETSIKAGDNNRMEEERETVSPLHSFESDNSANEDLGKPKYERKVTLDQQYMSREQKRVTFRSYLGFPRSSVAELSDSKLCSGETVSLFSSILLLFPAFILSCLFFRVRGR